MMTLLGVVVAFRVVAFRVVVAAGEVHHWDALAINASIMAFGLHHLSLRFGHQKNASQLMAPVLSRLFRVPADGTRALMAFSRPS